ncbi:MAG: DUF2723 domain-containing protein, partial [Elusimicrobia bacterium]|nr:DUF2723 domain-containing protein [Elusimicrobiota bacterium]
MTRAGRLRLAAAVGAGLFLLYMACMPPGLAPYRDAGEFSVAAHTLGVAHPPSYPLYVLLGRAVDSLPGATTDYRLGLFAAACAAGTAATLAWLAAAAGPAAGLTAGLAFGLDAVPWSVAMVQEMYSLMALLGSLLLAAAFSLSEAWDERLWLGACFFGGLSLGNRTDLLLWVPGLAVLAWPLAKPREAVRRALLRGAVFGLAGLSVYMYLPLRSMTGPWLDWNHPATLYNLIGSLTRRGYGGTLDLLSESYRTGANFLPNMQVYGAHLAHDLGLPAVLLALAGAVVLWRRRPRALAATGLLYLLSGPFFIFLANLPINPHAMAIVEPHYMLSDMMLALWAAEAVGAAPAAPWPAAALALVVAAAPFAQGGLGRMDRRWNLFIYDWADNALRCVPPGAALVAKEDVQIFGLWHAQEVLGRRPDVASVAEGLAHSPWEEAALRRAGEPVRLMGLRSPEEWKAFAAANPETWVTMDAEIRGGVSVGMPRGIAAPVPDR